MTTTHGHPGRPAQVVIGVDTHKHTHTAAVLAAIGEVLANQTVPTTPAGYQALPTSPSSIQGVGGRPDE